MPDRRGGGGDRHDTVMPYTRMMPSTSWQTTRPAQHAIVVQGLVEAELSSSTFLPSGGWRGYRWGRNLLVSFQRGDLVG